MSNVNIILSVIQTGLNIVIAISIIAAIVTFFVSKKIENLSFAEMCKCG